VRNLGRGLNNARSSIIAAVLTFFSHVSARLANVHWSRFDSFLLSSSPRYATRYRSVLLDCPEEPFEDRLLVKVEPFPLADSLAAL